jgi:hypothetical protein
MQRSQKIPNLCRGAACVPKQAFSWIWTWNTREVVVHRGSVDAALWSLELWDGSWEVQPVQGQLVQTTERPVTTTSSIGMVDFLKRIRLRRGGWILKKSGGEYTMRGVSVLVMEKMSRGTGSIEGGRVKTLQRPELRAVVPRLHSKLRERRERMQGCAGQKVRREVWKGSQA